MDPVFDDEAVALRGRQMWLSVMTSTPHDVISTPYLTVIA